MNSHVLSEFFLTKKWKMLRKRETICGNGRFKRLTKCLKIMLLVLIIASVVTMFLQVAGVIGVPEKQIQSDGMNSAYINLETESEDLSGTLYDPKEILEIIFSVLTISATLYTCLQIYLMKDINRLEMSHEIYKDDQEYRKLTEKAKAEMDLLYEELKSENITVESEEKLNKNDEESKFHSVLLEERFGTLRSFAYHYEYIGYLTLRDRLNFDVAFDTITFPNWLIASEKAKQIIKMGRQSTPDFWNGAEYLYCSYEVRRKYNKLTGFDRLSDNEKTKVTKPELKAKFKTACANWDEKYIKLV